MIARRFLACLPLAAALVSAQEPAPAPDAPKLPPLPLSTSYWKDPSFLKSFNGSYRIEARIEPPVSSEERGLLVEIQSLMEKGQRKEALAKLQSHPLTPKSAALRFNLGNLQLEESQTAAAITSYSAALKDYPSFRRAHRNLAVAHLRENDAEAALPPLLESIRLGDSDSHTYGLLGYCRLQKGEWASALQAYRLAQVTDPDAPEWKAGIAQCLQNLNGREEAAALLDEVIHQRPEEPSYAILQASILLELGRLEDAVKTLELPRRLNRLDGDGLLLLADLHLRGQRVPDALTLTKEAFLPPHQPAADRIAAVASNALAAREWELARTLLSTTEPSNDSPRPLRRLKARLLLDSGENPELGEKQLQDLVREDPTDGDSLLILARTLARNGRPTEAELIFQRATTQSSSAADAWIEIARLRVDAKRYASALEAVDEALALRPGGDLEAYRKALARLAEAAE